MEQAQVALKLLLDELGIAGTIGTVRERKTVQKAVYLAQAAGVDLGYRYNWYVMGPYSPGLTRDYFALDEALKAGESSGSFELQDVVKARLAKAKPLVAVPAEFDLGLSEWLELVASVHFLIVKQRLSQEAAREKLKVQKGHVAPFTDMAVEMLKDQGLLAA